MSFIDQTHTGLDCVGEALLLQSNQCTLVHSKPYPPNKNKNQPIKSWNEYLAGLIDGDGCLLLNNKNYASLEITMSIYDEHALNKIKQKLGGSVKLRTGARAFRYRLHHKKGIINLIHRINGLIRNSKRVAQLKKLCNFYNIPFKEPKVLNQNNAWFAGFFDADGTLGYSIKNGSPKLVLSVSNKHSVDLIWFQDVFGGYIRLDKRSNTYKWEIYTKEAIQNFSEYLKKYPLHSHKRKKIFLIKRYYELRACMVNQKAFSKPIDFEQNQKNTNSLLIKAWNQFEENWNDFSDNDFSDNDFYGND